MKITGKQNKFAENISEGMTYADAYRDAYPASKKWKDNAVYVKSSILMTNGKVLVRVKELRDEIQDKLTDESVMTLEKILKKLSVWIMFNPKSIMNPDGSMKEFAEMTDEEAECIQDFQVQEIWGGDTGSKAVIGVLKRVKLIDKRAVSDQWMKHFGAYLNKIELNTDSFEHLSDLLKDIEE